MSTKDEYLQNIYKLSGVTGVQLAQDISKLTCLEDCQLINFDGKMYDNIKFLIN